MEFRGFWLKGFLKMDKKKKWKQVDSLLSKKPDTPDKLFYWYYSTVQDTMEVIINNLIKLIMTSQGCHVDRDSSLRNT